jgi:hypothetical protein
MTTMAVFIQLKTVAPCKSTMYVLLADSHMAFEADLGLVDACYFAEPLAAAVRHARVISAAGHHL